MPLNTLRIVAFREGDLWIGQCLGVDICSQADTLETLRKRMDAIISFEHDFGERENGEAFAGISPAPSHFHDMWNENA